MTSNQHLQSIHILIIEDMAVDADLILLELQRENLRVRSHVTPTLALAKEYLAKHTPDLILADFSIPGNSGHDILRTCKQLQPDTPFIFVSGALGEDVAVDMVKNGADDYVLKHRMRKLVPAVKRVMAERNDRRDLAAAHRELFNAANVQRTFLQVVPDSMLIISDNCVLQEYFHGQDVPSALYFGGLVGTDLAQTASPLREFCSEIAENIRAMSDEGMSSGSFKYNLDHVDSFLENLCFEVRIARNSQGQSWVVVVKDITAAELQRRELEDSHAQLQRADELKSQLLANLSHEVRTPMNGIIGVSSLLAETATTEEHRELASMLSSSSQRLMHGLANVLCLAEIESGTYQPSNQPFHLDEVFAGVKDKHLSCLQKERVSLELKNLSPNDVVVGDFTSVLTICRNLLSNSCKFTHHGSISMHLGVVNEAESTFLCIEQKDTGIGIATEFVDTAFQKFTQASTGLNRSYEGAGLGLAVVSKLVEILGGTISVDTKEGGGTGFRILLPITVQNGAFDTKNTYFEHVLRDAHQNNSKVVLLSISDSMQKTIEKHIENAAQLLCLETVSELENQLKTSENIAVVLPETRAAEVMLSIEKNSNHIQSLPSIVVWGESGFTCYNHAPVTGSKREAGIHSFEHADFSTFLRSLQRLRSGKRLV